MFCVIYRFEVKEESTEQFMHSWEELTNMFVEYSDSLGSRLHKSSGNTYVAYAQWQDESAWRLASERLPESAQELRDKMRQSCKNIDVEYELQVLSDLLVSNR